LFWKGRPLPAQTVVDGVEAMKTGQLSVRSLQEYRGEKEENLSSLSGSSSRRGKGRKT